MIGGSASAARGRVSDTAREVNRQTATVLNDLEKEDDYPKAESRLQEIFDQVIGHAGQNEWDAFLEADFPLRLVRQLSTVDSGHRRELLKYLRDNDELARTLAYTIRPHEENPAEVYGILNELRNKRGDRLNDYASLATAIAVVHDQPITRMAGENIPAAAGPIELFDYFSQNSRKMNFDPRRMPAELLVYVVNSQVSIDEMLWALSNYAGNNRLGALYHKLPFDQSHYTRGTPKESEMAGNTLPNLYRYGGVAEDRAFFTAMVGKAIGTSTAITTGSNQEITHHWIGFLQGQRGGPVWNFEVGRFDALTGGPGLAGEVLDPQLNKRIPDTYVMMTAPIMSAPIEQYWQSIALTDAAQRLMDIEEAGEKFQPAPLIENRRSRRNTATRKADLDTQLDLLEEAVTQSPANRSGWFAVRDLADAGKLNARQKEQWTNLLGRTVGDNFPDFYFEFVRPMIATVEDVGQQNSLWESAYRTFRRRPDLAAKVRMAQGEMWEKDNKPQAALGAYTDIINRFANAGPFVMDALKAADSLMAQQRVPPERIVNLYAKAWNKIRRPSVKAPEYLEQSNWYQVGQMYADKLDGIGDTQRANGVRTRISVRQGNQKPSMRAR